MNIAVTVPVHALIQPATAGCLNAAAEHLRQHGHRVELSFLTQESLISRARDMVTARFLGSLNDALISVDSDVVFAPEQMRALVERHLPAVSGNYLGKLGEPTGCDATLALGFVLLHRDALEDVIRARQRDEAFPLDWYPHQNVALLWGFHTPLIREARYLDDAASLSLRLRLAGVTPVVDDSISVGHSMRMTRHA